MTKRRPTPYYIGSKSLKRKKRNKDMQGKQQCHLKRAVKIHREYAKEK